LAWSGEDRSGKARQGTVNKRQRREEKMAKAKGTAVKTVEDIGFWSEYILRMLLEGITPFLQNSPKGMKTKEKGIKGEEVYIPAEDAEKVTYRRDDGTLGFTAVAVRKCLLGGATGLRIGNRAAATVLAESIGHFPPLEGDELFPFEDLEGHPISDYEIDTRRAIRGRQGVVISRPKIWPWRLRCALKLTLPRGTDVDLLQRSLVQVANKAGQYPGLGDGRPEKIKGKGLWFGKFKVVEMEIEPLEE
jgi:hypothetical protein